MVGEINTVFDALVVVFREVDVLTELQDGHNNDTTRRRFSVTPIVPLFM